MASGGDADFIVSLEVAPVGVAEGIQEVAQGTEQLTGQTRAYGESTRVARAGADDLGAALRRQQADAAALAEATQRNILDLTEYYRTLQAGSTAAAAGINQRIAVTGVSMDSEQAAALRAQLEQERQLGAAIAARAEILRQSDAVEANLSAMRERTAELQQQLADYLALGPAAAAAAAEIRAAVASSGAAAGSPQAASVEAEAAAQAILRSQITAVIAAREADAAAAAAEAAAQQRLAATLSSLRAQTSQTAEMVAAERQGAVAVAALNRELATRNALLQAGVAAIDAEGRLVILNQEGAAAIRSEVVALQEEQAQLASLRDTADSAGMSFGFLERTFLRMAVMMVFLGIAAQLKDAVQSAVAFEDALTRLKTLVGVNVQEVDSYRGAIHAISLETGQSAEENAKAMFAITSSGQRGQQALDTLKASAEAAALGLGDETEIARQATAAMIAYGNTNLSANEALGVIIATARAGNVAVETLTGAFGRVTAIAATVGVSFDQVGAALATMTRMGVSADLAATGLRSTLSALELKESKGAEKALATVGLSVAALRKEIQDQGLAAALVDLVQRFKGNNDELAKLIPNIRSLAEVLGTAGVNGAAYKQVADEVHQGMQTALADATALNASNPAHLFALMSVAMSEVRREIGEALLPQLLAMANQLRALATNGDSSGWIEVMKISLAVLIGIVQAFLFALQNLPVVLAAAALWMVGSGAAATGLAAALAAVDVGLGALAATVAANPLGALAVAIGLIVIALNNAVSAQKAADEAFLEDVAKANQDALAIAALRKEYELLNAAKGATSGPAAQVGGGQIVLRNDFDRQSFGTSQTFLGQLQEIRRAYDLATAAAGGNKDATAAAAVARDRDTSALIANEQAVVNNMKAVQAREKSQLAAMQTELDAARQTAQIAASDPFFKQREQRVAILGLSGAPTPAGIPGGEVEYVAKVHQAQAAQEGLTNKIKVQTATIQNESIALDQLQKELDLATVKSGQHGEAAGKEGDKIKTARLEIEKQLAVRKTEAESAAAVAVAQLQGVEAVRQATIAASANKQIEEEVQRLHKAGMSLEAARADVARNYAARIRETAAAASDAQQISLRDAAVYQQTVAVRNSGLQALAKENDALAGNTVASQLATAQIQGEAQARTQGYEARVNGVLVLRAEGQALIDNAVALAQAAIGASNFARQTALAYDSSVKLREAQALLADEVRRSTVASQETAIALAVEKELRAGNVSLVGLQGMALALWIAAQQQALDLTHAQTAAQKELNAATDEQARARAELSDWREQEAAIRAYGSGVAGILQQYGLLSDATKELALQEKKRQEIIAEGENADAAAIEATLRGQQRELDSIHQVQAAEALAAYAIQPIRDAWESFGQQFESTLADMISTGKADWESLAQSFLRSMIVALEEWLARYITVQQIMRAEAAATAAVSAAAQSGGTLASGGVNPGSGSSVGIGTVGSAVGGAGGAYGMISTIAVGNPMIGGYAGSVFGGGLGAAAAVFAWIAAITIVVAVINNFVSTHQSTRAQGELALRQGQFALDSLRGAREMTGALAHMIDQISANLNAYLIGMGLVANALDAQIGITRSGRNRSNEFRVYVTDAYGSQLVKNFGRDADAAMQDAFYEALAHSTLAQQVGAMPLDPMVLAAVRGAAQRAADAMQAGITDAQKKAVQQAFDASVSAAKEVATLGQPAFVATERQTIDHFESLRQTMLAILPASDNLVHALGNINAAEVQMWMDQRDQITGRQKTEAEQLATAQQNAKIFNAELQLRILGLEQSKIELEAEQAKLLAHQVGIRGTVEYAQTVLSSMDALGRGAVVFGETAQAVTGQLTIINQAQWDLLTQQIAATADLIAQLQAIKPIDPSEIVIPGSGGGGGGATSRRQQQQIEEQAARFGLNPVALALLDAQKNFADFTKAVHDAGFRGAEAARLLAEGAAELARQNAKIKADQLQSNAQFLFAGTPYEGPLLSGLSGVTDAMYKLEQGNRDLYHAGLLTLPELHRMNADLEASARRQESAAIGDAGNQLLLQLYGYLGETANADKLKFDMAVAELEMKRAELAIAIEQYHMQAQFPNLLAQVDALIARVIAAGPAGMANPGGGAGGNSQIPAAYAAQQAANEAAAAASASRANALATLKGIEESFLPQIQQDLLKVDAQFQPLWDALGHTARVQQDYALMIQQVMDKYLAPIRNELASMDLSAGSPLRPGAQLQLAEQQLLATYRQIQAGDYSHLDQVVAQSQALRTAMAAVPQGSVEYLRLWNELKSILGNIDTIVTGAPPPGTPPPPPPLPGTTPGAPPAPGTGGAPPPTVAIDWTPLIAQVQAASTASLTELRQIRDNTASTVDEVTSLRDRMDRPLSVFQSVS